MMYNKQQVRWAMLLSKDLFMAELMFVYSWFLFQSMTLKEAIKSSLTILKQVMEEKLNATNIEVNFIPHHTREGTCTLHLISFYTPNLVGRCSLIFFQFIQPTFI